MTVGAVGGVDPSAAGPRRRRRERFFAPALSAPAVLASLVLLALPLLYSLWISLHDVRPDTSIGRFVGLANYRQVVGDELFPAALRRSILLAAGVVLGTVLLGLLFAVVLDGDMRGRSLLRGLMILPWSLSQTTLALMFGWIFNETYGPLNSLLVQTGIADSSRSWFATGPSALRVIAIACVWGLVPFATLLLLGALQSVPRELLRAAVVDGAGPLLRFRTVTLPYIADTLFVVFVLATANGFLIFAPILVLTGGGPGTDTTTLAWLGYRQGFVDLDYGASAATFWVLTVVILAFGSLGMAIRRARIR